MDVYVSPLMCKGGFNEMLHIDLDRQSGVPIYLQIKFRIKELIEQGIWRHGFKLPTERKLANELEVSRNTLVT